MIELEKEINKNKLQEEIFAKQINNEKNKFANMILNGMGEKIKNEAETPPQIIKHKWYQKLYKKIKNMFNNDRILNGGTY